MKPFSPFQRQQYHKVRCAIQMRTADRSGRITVSDVVIAFREAGYTRSLRYTRAVLAGEKISRPALREVRAVVREIRRRREHAWPHGL